MLRIRRSFVFLLVSPISLFAQWIEPSGGDPVAVACPNGPASGSGINPLDAWRKAKETAAIEGDGVFGIGNWGHTAEALEWYCKASAAGNAVAAYDIAEISREGYVVNSEGPGGRIITKHFLPDLPTAFYWYQLAANRGFTKAMLALAQFYALGDQVLKGSHVTKNVQQAALWLNKAADKGDTIALTMLAMRYAGLRTAPWGMALPIPTDSTRALSSVTRAIAILTKFDSDCSSADAVKDMIDQLPDASEGRNVRGASVVEVHGSSASGPLEADCLLSLSGPPPSQQNEPVVAQFYRLIHGGAVNSWKYSITQIPGINESIMFRETATQAMTEGIEELQILIQTLPPPSENSGKKR